MIYEYKCRTCNAVHEKTFKLKEFTTTVVCPHCAGIASKVLSLTANNRTPVFQEYHDKVQGRSFKTKREFNSYCKEKNLYKPTQSEIKAHRDKFQVTGKKGNSSHVS